MANLQNNVSESVSGIKEKFHLRSGWLALKVRSKLLGPLLNTKHIQRHVTVRKQRSSTLLQKKQMTNGTYEEETKDILL